MKKWELATKWNRYMYGQDEPKTITSMPEELLKKVVLEALKLIGAVIAVVILGIVARLSALYVVAGITAAVGMIYIATLYRVFMRGMYITVKGTVVEKKIKTVKTFFSAGVINSITLKSEDGIVYDVQTDKRDGHITKGMTVVIYTKTEDVQKETEPPQIPRHYVIIRSDAIHKMDGTATTDEKM